jgi:predicted TIM-barrel fold metal-dependent hydrolase
MGSKPCLRKRHVPLNSKYYEGFWSACEDMNFPVLCHVGDVEDFWYEHKTLEWAKSSGWGYWKGDYPTLGELQGEIKDVLNLNRGLMIVLCHFFFMSPILEDLSEFLDSYPKASLDLSLGVELMYNISRRVDDYKDFFRRYEDRLLFGTDIGMSTTLPEHLERIWMIRKFLESSDEFYTPQNADKFLTQYEEPFIGLGLKEGTLDKIYANNFRRLWGDSPRRVDKEKLRQLLLRDGKKVITEYFREFP